MSNSPESVYWFRAFLDYEQSEKEKEHYQKELLTALIWVGNMVGHSGTVVSNGLVKGGAKKDLRELYRPDSWRAAAREIDKKKKATSKSIDEEIALSFIGI